MVLERRALVGALVVSTLALVPAAPAAAAPASASVPAVTAAAQAAGWTGHRPEPWRPWIQEEWTAPAGRYCSFPLEVRVVSQDIRVRVLARHPDGAVKREEFAGPLTVDFVNADTGASVRRDAGGSGAAEYRPDGSYAWYTIVGPAGFGFRAGDGLPKGYYILDGLHVISFDADGTRRLAVGIGDRENVCDPPA
ncbi:hypothetical protein AB0M79_26700 [Polymorphospora sp. NPDC051019]|uniref:hypothetical protein n=1 Tax=Polymorphospora sp. NPDC051019 TaxID=3155725 RepID=UPI00341FD114